MARKRTKSVRLSRKDQARIRRHLQEHPNEDMVVKVKSGAMGKIYTLSTNEKMRQSAKQHKPWEHRQATADVPDPLGAVDMGVLVSPLTREHMYDE
jgi:hypothetical protein